MSEDMCAICFETSFNHVKRHVSTMFEDMFTPCLITYFCIVWYTISTLCIMFQGIFTLRMRRFKQRQPVDGIFLKCLNPYSFKIDQFVLLVENG